MAANMKEIKARIDSVKSTSQITKAMDIVSSTKFKRFQALTLASRAYSHALDETFENIVSSLQGDKHILFDGKSEVKKVAIVIMTSDRGLCGSFNNNALKELEKLVNKFQRDGKDVSVITVGKKGRDFCKRRNIEIDSEYVQMIPETIFDKAKNISEEIVRFYMNNLYDEVYLIYSKFISAISYELSIEKLLPVAKSTKSDETKKVKEYLFEPTKEKVLEIFIPKRLNMKLYQSLLENTASEHSARMTAMKSASDNAGDMIEKLTLEYNRVRQAIITQELSEIVGGSEALK